jgi:hypothetical protein
MSSYPGDERYAVEQPNRARQDAPPIDVAAKAAETLRLYVRSLVTAGNQESVLCVSIAALLSAYEARGKEIEQLRIERDAARLAHQCSEGVLSMTVARLGGIVEGNPTGRHNFLQRIDELREIERTWQESHK